jgi:transposase
MIDSDLVAKHYLPVERNQPFLLPPSVQEFIPEDDLAWFLIDAVAAMDTSVFHRRARRGHAGRAGYDPDMLLTLLIYAYCLGQRSSRRIEQLCVRDLGFKVVTGNRVIDHSTIAEFRAIHQDAIVTLFAEVLLLCAKAGLRQVGVVAVDGTKIGASASMDKTRQRETLIAERDRLAAEVEQMLAEAARTDAAQDALFGPDKRGDELPEMLRHKADRLARLRETLRQMEQVRAEHDAAEHGHTPTGRPRRADKVATAQRRLDQLLKRRDQRIAKERAADQDGGRLLPGSRPDFDALIAQAEAELDAVIAETTGQPGTDLVLRPGTDLAHPGAAIGPTCSPRPGTDLALRPGCSVEHMPHAARHGNATDPHSRMLKARRGFIQGYNGQVAAVRVQHGRRLVLAAAVTQDSGDVRQAVPMMAAATANAEQAGLGTVRRFALDAGYFSEDNLTAPGPDRLIALTKNHIRIADLRANGYATGDPAPDATPAEAMRHRLRTKDGADSYAQRAPTVEPVFGEIKHGRGFRTFQRRGLTAVDSEWKLIHATGNLRVLHRHTRSATEPPRPTPR